MNDFLKTPKTKTLLWILCGVLAILVVFGLGIAVGYHRAIFASGYGENYYHNFYRGPFTGVMGFIPGPPPMNMHGVAGEVIDVSSGTISVRDTDGNEQSVLLMSDTPIREMNTDISESDIQPDDQVIVIGEPNDTGQVEARFIRVFAATTTQ